MRRALAVFAALGAVLASAVGARADSGDYRVGSGQVFETPNPFKATLAIAVEAYSTLYFDQLIATRTTDQGPDYSSSLASGRKVSTDGKTIVFTIRTGLHWSDGQAFTSEDVRWTFQAVLDNKTNQLRSAIAAVTSLKAPTPDTFVLTLKTRDSEFLDKLAIPILPKHIWSKIPTEKLDKVDGPVPMVTTAPYVLTKWEKNGTTILTRNAKFDVSRNGGKLPAPKRILITGYLNRDALYRDVDQGNLDYGHGGEPAWASRSKGNKQLQLISSPRGGYWEIAFNSCPPKGSTTCTGPGKGVNVKVVQDLAIRRALAYAIDREKFIPTVYSGIGKTAYGLISPRFKFYYQERKGTPLGYDFNLSKAKATLKAGGWNCARTPCVKNGVKATFELVTLTSNKRFQQMAQRIVADARKVGIVITTSFQSEDAVNNRIYASGTKKDLYAPNYDAFLWDWDVSGTTPTPILEVLRSNDTSSDSFYVSKAYDDALLRAKQATTKAATVGAVRDAEAVALRDLPYLPLVHESAVEVYRRDTWHGYLPSPAPDGRTLFESGKQIFALQPGPEPVPSSATPAAAVIPTKSGGLSTPVAVLIGFGMLSAAILGATLLAGRRRRGEPLEWTEE